MIKKEKDNRQVPKSQEICANKKYYDILYAYLQYISDRDEETNIRYFLKSDINFSKLGEIFSLSRQTVSTKFKNLKDLGLIIELDEQRYQLVLLEAETAALIPYSTLKILVDTLNEKAISTYIYLLNRYYAKDGQAFVFTLDQIKKYIGISVTTRSNNDVVTNILYVLSKLGLIKYSLTTVAQDGDNFQNVKTIYQLDWLTNTLN